MMYYSTFHVSVQHVHRYNHYIAQAYSYSRHAVKSIKRFIRLNCPSPSSLIDLTTKYASVSIQASTSSSQPSPSTRINRIVQAQRANRTSGRSNSTIEFHRNQYCDPSIHPPILASIHSSVHQAVRPSPIMTQFSTKLERFDSMYAFRTSSSMEYRAQRSIG